MGKLSKYASQSKIMDISISYNNEVFKFNLNKELIISEHKLTNEVKTHVRSYAFIAMLHKKLIIKHKELNKKLKHKKDMMIPLVRKKYNYSTVKEAEAYLSKNKKLAKMESELLHLEEVKDIMEVAVKSFEYRQELLRTLSANVRNEK